MCTQSKLSKQKERRTTSFVPYSQPKGKPMVLKHGTGPRANVRNELKSFILNEYLAVKANLLPGTTCDLCRHYQLSDRWFRRARNHLQLHKTLESNRLNCGTKRKWDSDVTQKCRTINRAWNRRASQSVLASELGFDQTTVGRNLKKEKYTNKKIRPTPKLSEQNIADRNDFARAALSGRAGSRHTSWIDCADIDEKIFKLPGFSGSLRVHPDSDLDSDDEDLHPKCQSRRFIPGIMVTAAVCRPQFHRDGRVLRSGLIGIWRCWDEAERKQSRWKYAVDPETGSKVRVGSTYKKGEKYMKDVNVDAEFHHTLMTTKILPAIRQYFGRRKQKFDIACQQDGAGGHGAKSHWSYLTEQDAKTNIPPVFFHTQPANSPCLNLCDLGLWPMIQKHVNLKRPKTTDELWEYIQEGFWAIDAHSLDNMCHQKTVTCVQIAHANGGVVANDKHTGYRTAKAKLGRVPTWVEMRRHAKQDARWIYNYEPGAAR